jgi:hypothetical protein
MRDAITCPSSMKTKKLVCHLLKYAKLVFLFEIPQLLILLTSLIGPT